MPNDTNDTDMVKNKTINVVSLEEVENFMCKGCQKLRFRKIEKRNNKAGEIIQ